MKTVHLIFNAHLDPIWLWPWPAGLDEALATCRSACDRLDAHEDLHFVRGEAWVYSMSQQTDPVPVRSYPRSYRRRAMAHRQRLVDSTRLQSAGRLRDAQAD